MYSNYLFKPNVELDEYKGRFYSTLILPKIEETETDVYVITTFGDRLDLLAFEYYSDSTLWKVIALANSEYEIDSVFVELGMQLRIPINNSIDFLELVQTAQIER